MVFIDFDCFRFKPTGDDDDGDEEENSVAEDFDDSPEISIKDGIKYSNEEDDDNDREDGTVV